MTAPELELTGFVDQRVLEPLEPESARGWGRAHFKAKLWPRWHAADLAPKDSRGDDAELTTLEPEAWSCPKRSVSR